MVTVGELMEHEARAVEISWGTERVIDGRLRVYYDGYWIKAYAPPADTLLTKKWLIQALTRRLFDHVEHGLNVPGSRLDEARKTYDEELDPQRKRVKGSMLAGALFNRAGDIFTKLVEMQALGVQIQSDNALMRQCGEHLQEALTLGRMVLHRSGEEGIDELWGEPFKAFALPVEDFYRSRYVKIAMTMAALDQIAAELARAFGDLQPFAGIDRLFEEFTAAAKAKCETLRTDPDIFDIWTSLVVAGEKLMAFQPLRGDASVCSDQYVTQGMDFVREAKELIFCITRARVPMPKTTRDFLARLKQYRSLAAPAARRSAPEHEAVRGL
jgi:hypothetical protein